MKTPKFIIIIFGLLLTAQAAFAWYDPSTQRWLNRDPIKEIGFQTLQKTSIDEESLKKGIKLILAFMQGDLMPSDIAANAPEYNLYCFTRNDSFDHIDLLGLSSCPCTSAPSLPANSSACDKYGNEKYPGTEISLKCFCKSAGDSAWSQQVRGCLACEHDKGTPVGQAHRECYGAAGWGNAPWGTLISTFIGCGGIPVIIATQ